MKYIQLITIIFAMSVSSCKKTIDLYPLSNLNTGTFYSNTEEVKAGLTGVYRGLMAPMSTEWQMTEMRSDNSLQGIPASTNSLNRDYSDLDMFIPAPTMQNIYLYWLNTYNNIRNANIILSKLGVNYDPATGSLTLSDINIPISDADRKQFAGEALFIRAHHYFNLVRLFGGVFLVHKPISADEAKGINRSTVNEIYKLIEADLTAASSYMSSAKFASIPSANKGRANAWAAKALLAKVYLTQNNKAQAITLLEDVKNNSGFALQATYASVFATSNEVNSEILFTVRYRAGGLGLGSSFGNDFGPLNSGSAVINGSGRGWNTPSREFDTAFIATDKRRPVNISSFGTGTALRIYTPKYLTPVVLTDDGESDWPVIRFADVLLMLAEAKGYTQESIGYINQMRTRAGIPTYIAADITDVATFEQALSNERRLELAFENQRYFDLMRFNTTMTTITAEQTIKNHFAKEYAVHYSNYLLPTPTLAELQANVTADRLLLPIPQREIDTNTNLKITQNPSY